MTAGDVLVLSDRVQSILAEVRRGLEEIYGPRLKGLVVFGSYARGEATPDSDLDVLFILEDFESPVAEINRTSGLASDVSLEHDLTVSLLPVREQDWRSRDSAFLAAVGEEGALVP